LTFFGLASGAEASVWGTATVIPELAVALYNALAVDNDLNAGRELWKKIWPICDFLESVNYYAGIKAGCELIGASVGPVRPPGLPLSAEQKAHFAKLLNAAGVKTV
jgi:dihydrodipicolinate synthase/N-acetylneuraminate lyase